MAAIVHAEFSGAMAAMDALAKRRPGDHVHARGPELAAAFAADLAEPRPHAGRGGRSSTLVSWEAADPEAETLRLLAEGFVVR